MIRPGKFRARALVTGRHMRAVADGGRTGSRPGNSTDKSSGRDRGMAAGIAEIVDACRIAARRAAKGELSLHVHRSFRRWQSCRDRITEGQRS